MTAKPMCSGVSHLPAELFYCFLKLEIKKKNSIRRLGRLYAYAAFEATLRSFFYLGAQFYGSAGAFYVFNRFFCDPDFVWTSYETFTPLFL